MPLVDGEWKDTTPEDIEAFRASLGLQEVRLSEQLEARISNVAASVAQAGITTSMAALIGQNQRLYSQLSRILAKPIGSVDIVVPVYNAWHVTRACLEAVIERTTGAYALIVVDDCSDDRTRAELMKFQDAHPDTVVLRNPKNRGFAATVNRGIRHGKGHYVCLLNSDVLVTEGWLTKMVLALEADERNAIVCPATNNTAVVDIPMSEGASYLQMNAALEQFAQRRYPEIMPTGFCFLFKRSHLEEVGYFDEAYKNFGEESDFWWKTVKAGKRAVMADDAYVFHERASSFSALGSDAHMAYRRMASGRFNQLWPEWVEWRDAHDVKRALGSLRKPVPAALLRSTRDLYRICWLVHDARPCGAMRYIADVANALIERGVNVKVAVLLRAPDAPREALGELHCAPVYFASMSELLEQFPSRVFGDGLVMAGTVELSPAVRALVDASGGSLRGCLHAQSFEPAMVETPEERAHLLALYKLLPDVIASSQWVAEEIAALGVAPFACVAPGVNRELFYPRGRGHGDERPTVMVPMNPAVWWRGWERGLELVRALESEAERRGVDLRILVYGADSLRERTRAICLGQLTQTRLAQVLGTEVDVFVDPSQLHSYGMPGLEAIASGVPTVSWNNRGVFEYELAVRQIFEATPATMAREVVTMAQSFLSPSQEARDYIATEHDRALSVGAFAAAVERHFRLCKRKLRICVIAPHMRKWGGPTTMLAIAQQLQGRGHTVQMVSVYEDVHPSIAASAEVPILKAPKEIPEADLYITNSDNPWTDRVAALPAKKILLKLSHNPRFKREEEKGLQQTWDAIVTSTQWLADVCALPTEGWSYPPVQASVIGWWHYEHERFRCPTSERTYGDGSAERPFVIGTLIHAHPTKGTPEALEALAQLSKDTDLHFRFVGIGEVPPRAVKAQVEGLEYVYEPTRDKLAEVMKTLDVWLSCSKSEGLGRMALEAMSAGALVVSGDTGGDHLSGAIVYTDDPLTALRSAISSGALYPTAAFDLAERAADPTNCINALEKVIEHVFE